jgi:hypothetical protein
MKGVLKFSQHMLDNLSYDLGVLVTAFVAQGVCYKTVTDNGQVYMLLDHPDFTDRDKDTEYLLYFGNRYDRVTGVMVPRLLHLDKIGVNGRLEPVRYYNI